MDNSDNDEYDFVDPHGICNTFLTSPNEEEGIQGKFAMTTSITAPIKEEQIMWHH